MFDRSFLPRANAEFVLIGDTHYMLDVDQVEFQSRRRQTDRAAHAFELVNALDPEFVVHIGDLVQEFPGSADFDTAVAAAREGIDRLEAKRRQVAGNHDVGDKPDPTMPTDPVTEESLAAYHERFGRSWYDWEHAGVRFVVLNSQIMNADLPVADDQRAWLEETLEAHDGGPVVIFLHLAPFIHDPEEPGLGHYDAIGRPAREWLLDLVEDHPIARVFSGHSHFAFRNRVGDTLFRVVGSPAFTRPGFSELFSSSPPPEQGRDDRGKLGFHLIRIHDGDLRLHHVRTHGATEAPERETSRLLTRTTAGIGDSPLGVSLAFPIRETATVPPIFPTAVRQPVANDYPALSCLELGVTRVRTAVEDAREDGVREALSDLRAEGVDVVGTVLTGDDRDPEAIEPEPSDPVDEVEIRIAGGQWPTLGIGKRIEACGELPVGLSPSVPARTVPGKQHDRLRTGYMVSELDELDDRLGDHGTSVDRVVCRVGEDDPWETIGNAPEPGTLSRIGEVDWLLSSTDLDAGELVDRMARATLAVAGRSGSRLYVEPLRALDRTMDVAPGLLDRQCNPTPAFDAFRCLNTVLFGAGSDWERLSPAAADGVDAPGVASSAVDCRLVTPADRDTPVAAGLDDLWRCPEECTIRAVSLADGRSRTVDTADADAVTIEETTLLAFEYGE